MENPPRKDLTSYVLHFIHNWRLTTTHFLFSMAMTESPKRCNASSIMSCLVYRIIGSEYCKREEFLYTIFLSICRAMERTAKSSGA